MLPLSDGCSDSGGETIRRLTTSFLWKPTSQSGVLPRPRKGATTPLFRVFGGMVHLTGIVDSLAASFLAASGNGVFCMYRDNRPLVSMAPPSSATACTPEAVRTLCEASGFSFDAKVLSALTAYLSLLSKWNRVMNLVGPTAWEDILHTLVEDSFHLASFVSSLDLPEHPRCWDLGSGAGLPGLPLRMLWSKGDYTLVEAREKRALFLRTVLAACPLEGVSVFQGRAEQFMPAHAPAHMIVTRAFMPWEKLLELVGPHLTASGFCVFLTLSSLPPVLPEGWTAAAETRYTVSADTRYFWALRKRLSLESL